MKSVGVNISNRNETLNIIKKYGFTLKKSLGQNFLIEPKILDKIIEKAEIDQTTAVIEIGPGIGALTQKLAEKADKVVAVEIDHRLVAILEETLSENPNVKVINADVLKISLKELIAKELADADKIKVVANLPYYITSSIIMKLLEERLNIDSITVMVQKEVAERISASPGGKEYGGLSLIVEYYAEARTLFTVPSSVFIPKPNVDSAILQLNIRQRPPVSVDDEEFLFRTIKAGFAQRRKTIINNLAHNLLGEENKEQLENLLRELEIDKKRRAETLSLTEFARICNLLNQNRQAAR